MFYDDHNPPHFHAEFGNKKAVMDFQGNILIGDLGSRTALKLIQEWVALHRKELLEDWDLAKDGKEIKRIAPLD